MATTSKPASSPTTPISANPSSTSTSSTCASSDRPASASSASSSASKDSASSRMAPQLAPRDQRPSICGTECPERPYPIYLRGEVERGFGRGGKDLGCPTANLPAKVLGAASALSRTGIYFGYARVLPQDPDDPDIDDSLTPGGGIENARSPTSPLQEGDELEDQEGEASDYYDEDDDENEVVLGASPITSEPNPFTNRNGNGEENSNGNGNGNGTGSGSKRSNSLHAGVERVPKPKSRQGSKSSIKSNKSVATLMAKLGKSDSNDNETSNGITGQNLKLETNSSSTNKDQDSTSENLISSSAQPLIGNHPPSSATQIQHPRNLSAASSSSSLRKGRKKSRIHLREEDSVIAPMVMSVGWNPFYGNSTKTAEVHIMHKFAADFYGLEIRVVVLGYIRPEYNYVDKDSLIEDIETDKRVGIASLERSAYQAYSRDPFLGR